MSTPQTTPIRVLVVDDHPTMRYGLTVFLSAQPDMECVGEAESGEEALALCRQLQPDVALVDLVMPGQDGATTIGQIVREMPKVRVIALTTYTDTALAQRAIRSGATSYLLKTVSTEDLAAAVRAAYAGQHTFTPEVTQALARVDDSRPAGLPYLTDREIAILRLVSEGKTDAEISHDLGITKSTIRFHLKSIFAKLGAVNRTEAVRIAMDYQAL